MEEKILKTEYSETMQKSFIDYAMSVIIARALPDVRDGLKPVQRRTLYDMHELGIRYDRPYRKSARIVGDTMGKYHPHGDSSIYEALVVLTQDFKKGIPLIDGHGNFGNIEGDGAAAMRYTEARLQKISQEALLADLDKDVVDFVPNFDETEKEPSVLPCRFPNLLVNGSEGIAVGMATSIPPHNLGEVIEATKAYMKNENITTKELMRYVKGPDFPTGGIVCNKDDLLSIYETGVGKIKLRGKVEVEKTKGGKLNLIISEIPYTMIGANIGKFLQDVAQLYEQKKAPEIVDISNQSSKEGIRIVIELKKDTDVENFKNLLYKKTRLEDTFGVNMIAIAGGRPETLGLKNIIAQNVAFQYEITTRKYTTLLNKELEKREIQEGLIRACNIIDLIIEILRGSKDRAMVKNCLTDGVTTGIKFRSKESAIMAEQLNFTEKQANAILDMRLYKLIGLEIEALMKENEQTNANIYRYEDILDRRDAMAQVIIQELDVIKKEYSKKRRTLIENAQEAVYEEKKPEEMDVIFLMDKFGYCKTIDMTTYERNKEAADAEFKYVVKCRNTGRICVFTNTGQLHTIKVVDIPFGKFRDKGQPIDNISNYNSANEDILAITSQSEMNLYRLLFVTKQSMCKIISGGEFDVAKRTVTSTKLSEGDEIVSVVVLNEQQHIILQSKEGYFLRFDISEISEVKKTALGVHGMKMGDNDYIEQVFYTYAGQNTKIEYKGKQIDMNKLKVAKRDAKGTKIRV
ncbi:MAG: DNA topoisomerase 4 subunit A [Lachnospiraceae bacterium]|jgi:Type IIA topoisomerase (DNA gyrase/topo II, topoisomerase IV), A subunit|nr:DNA topoisomerase 4 subunit A [Lachnospiraceae bacterium]